jgi:hypothetical protein
MDRETRFTKKHSVLTVCGIIPAMRVTGTEPLADCRSFVDTTHTAFGIPVNAKATEASVSAIR